MVVIMNKEQKSTIEYLLALTEYFILISDEPNNPKIIQELNDKLNEVLHEIHEKLNLEAFSDSDCQEFTDKIDMIILFSAELSMLKKAEYKEPLSVIKEKLWYLLENLEQYCVKIHGITIW